MESNNDKQVLDGILDDIERQIDLLIKETK